MTRGFAAHRVPWGNMYEYSVLLALLVVLGYLVIIEGYYKIRTLGGFALMFAVFTMAIAVSFLYVGPAPLVPALNSYWIKIHVVAAITGSSLLALGGGVLTILFLIQDRRERRQVATLRAQEPPPIMGGSVDVDAPPDFSPDADEPDRRRDRPAGRAADRGQPGPHGVSGDRVRVPDLDVRGDRRRHLGAARVGALLGLGSEGDVVVRHVGDLRGLPARALDVGMEGTSGRDHRVGRVRLAA